MQHAYDEKSQNERLLTDHSRLREQEALREDLTKMLINDVNGVMQCILGNTELLKIKYVHKFNMEAVGYLHKIEDNSKNLISLLNRFEASIRSAGKTPEEKPCPAASCKPAACELQHPHSVKSVE